MNGIEILATKEVVIDSAFNWGAFAIATAICFGIFLVAGIGISLEEGYWFGLTLCCIIGAIISAMIGAMVGYGMSTSTEYETQYKIIISDDVSMNEFLEKYEIVGQEGKIYTVRQRNVGS